MTRRIKALATTISLVLAVVVAVTALYLTRATTAAAPTSPSRAAVQALSPSTQDAVCRIYDTGHSAC
jgi:hypothetical protein